MGGGGGAGGGGGNGAGSGNGSGGADGSGSGEGAEGAGSGAGSCGNGTNGSCTNCSSGTAAGDPVNVVTGEVFTLPKTDLFLPGFFNLQIDRSYSSFNRKHDVGVGWGWTHSLAWALEEKRGSVEVRSGLGQRVEFPKLDAPGTEAGIEGWGLMRLADGYVLRPGNEFLHFFSAHPTRAGHYLLDTIKFRNRGVIRLEYDARGALVRIVDTAGRTIQMAVDGSGRITSITAPSPRGGAITFARFAYDPGGHLVEAVDADGHAFRYDYDDDRRLIRMHTPTGLVVHFLYDGQGRCVETWGDRADGPDPALGPSVGDLLADGVTKAKGILHVKIEYGPDGYSEVVDSARVQRFFGEAGGTVTKGITGRGGVVTRQLDAAGRVAAQMDAAGATWSYRYDGLGNVVERVDPEGHALRLDRDREGRIVRAIDPAGGEVEYVRDAHGEITTLRDPRGGMRSFTHTRRGLLASEQRPDGTTVRLEHDAMGNVVRYVRPNGAITQFEYDYWGRLSRQVSPKGHELHFGYSLAGRLTSIQDNLGRSRTISYDPYGNRLTDADATGQVLRFYYGGLGWLVAAEHPSGEIRRAEYNREGWVTCFVNEKGQRHEIERDRDGTLKSERSFDGVVRHYRRDARGFVVSIEDDLGKTKIERDKLGRAIRVEGPSGAARKFQYDARGELVEAESDGVRFRLDRDALGDVVRETWAYGETSFVVESGRDLMGRRAMIASNLGLGVQLRRDGSGFVKELITEGDAAVVFERDAVGLAERRHLPRGGTIASEYDAGGRVRRHAVSSPNAPPQNQHGQPAWIGGPPPGAIDKTYAYLPDDELASVTTLSDGTTEYRYDARKRLVERQSRQGRVELRYDETDNLHDVTPDAAPRLYDHGNRLVQAGTVAFDYDERGRLSKRRELDDGGRELVTRYAWDDWDMLGSVELPNGDRLEYAYDAFARRCEKKRFERGPLGGHRWLSTVRYVWDLTQILHEVETRADGSAETRSFLYEDADSLVPLAQRKLVAGATSDWVYLVKDHGEAPEELVDGSGVAIARSSHTPHGEWTWLSGSAESTSFRFAGQSADPETGLHYNRYRYYDPALGRFLSKDPILLAGGFNAYRYGPNPIGWADPMGWADHRLTARWYPEGSDEASPDMPGSWVSTMGVQESGIECPDCLASQARCHTERQAMHHLESNPSTRGRLEGSRLAMEGQLPPCPQCHRAMHDFAQRHGAKVTYDYPGGRITYEPGEQPSPDGAGAEALLGGAEDRRGNYGDLSPTAQAREGRGGYGPEHGTAGAAGRYTFEGSTPSRAYADERDAVRAGAYGE
jgi:RHS repeat-associated protein